MAASKKPNERRPKGEAKVITVGWQAVLIPFIILAVVALGFYAGRMLSGSDSSASAVQPLRRLWLSVVPEDRPQVLKARVRRRSRAAACRRGLSVKVLWICRREAIPY